jgi:transcriptional regulator with XRE-family HTH domain
LHDDSVQGRAARVIAKSATDAALAERLQRRRWELGLSTYAVAADASKRGFINCTAKKVSQIEIGKRGLRSRAELLALAHALETTAHALTTGLPGQDGEPVILVGVTARESAENLGIDGDELLARLGLPR